MTTRRPKPPENVWLIEQRKRRGWKPEDVAARMDVAVPTVRGWESGRGIGPDSLMRLEALFGVAAPDHGAAPTDLAALLSQQNGYLERITLALEHIAGISPDAEPRLSPGDSTALRSIARSWAPTGLPTDRPEEVSR